MAKINMECLKVYADEEAKCYLGDFKLDDGTIETMPLPHPVHAPYEYVANKYNPKEGQSGVGGPPGPTILGSGRDSGSGPSPGSWAYPLQGMRGYMFHVEHEKCCGAT